MDVEVTALRFFLDRYISVVVGEYYSDVSILEMLVISHNIVMARYVFHYLQAGDAR